MLAVSEKLGSLSFALFCCGLGVRQLGVTQLQLVCGGLWLVDLLPAPGNGKGILRHCATRIDTLRCTFVEHGVCGQYHAKYRYRYRYWYFFCKLRTWGSTAGGG